MFHITTARLPAVPLNAVTALIPFLSFDQCGFIYDRKQVTPCFFSSLRRTLNLIQPNRKQPSGFTFKTGQPSGPILLSKALHHFRSNIPFFLHRNVQALRHFAIIFVLVLLVTPPVNWSLSANKMPSRICSYGRSHSQKPTWLAWTPARRRFSHLRYYGLKTLWRNIRHPYACTMPIVL